MGPQKVLGPIFNDVKISLVFASLRGCYVFFRVISESLKDSDRRSQLEYIFKVFPVNSQTIMIIASISSFVSTRYKSPLLIFSLHR